AGGPARRGRVRPVARRAARLAPCADRARVGAGGAADAPRVAHGDARRRFLDPDRPHPARGLKHQMNAAVSPIGRKHNALWALSVVRIKLFLREPGSLFWVFVFPLLITVALGAAFRTQGPPRNAVAVVAGPTANATATALAGDPALKVEILEAGEAARRLRTGEAVLAVDAPATPGGPVTFRYDPSRPEAAGVRRLADDVLQAHAGRRDPLSTRDETAVVRGARYVDWMVPG